MKLRQHLLISVLLFLPATVVKAENRCSNSEPLIRRNYSGSDLISYLKKTGAVAAADETPEIKFFDQLSASQKRRLDTNAYGKAFAQYVPEGLLGNSKSWIVLERNIPFYAATIAMAHELQHSRDTNAAWQIGLTRLIRKKENSYAHKTALTLSDIEAQTTVQSLAQMKTLALEFRAFSQASRVKRKMIADKPCIEAEWENFKQKSKIETDLDPENLIKDQSELVRNYIWCGNLTEVSQSLSQLSSDSSFKKAGELLDQSGFTVKMMRIAVGSADKTCRPTTPSSAAPATPGVR
jgi:hypothetical protein